MLTNKSGWFRAFWQWIIASWNWARYWDRPQTLGEWPLAISWAIYRIVAFVLMAGLLITSPLIALVLVLYAVKCTNPAMYDTVWRFLKANL